MVVGTAPQIWAQVTVRLQANGPEHSGPLADAPVWCFCTEGSSVGRQYLTFSDSLGVAQCPFQAATAVRVSLVGYAPVHDTLLPGTETVLNLLGNGTSTEQIVITAQSEPTLAERSTFQVRVIDRARIEAQGAVNLRDVLATELNIRLSQDNILGSSLALQGLSGQNVKIMIDNVPVVGRLNGVIDLSQINLNDIERIEIIEGPMSVSFGTDALGGVINLITRRASSAKWSASANAYTETVGHYNQDAAASLRRGVHQVRLSGGRNFFDGWNASPTSGRTFQWKPREQLFGAVQYGLTKGRHSVRLKSQVFGETILNRGAATVTPVAAYAFDEYYRTLRLSNDVAYRLVLPRHLSVDVLAAANTFSRRLETLRTDLTTLEQQPIPSAEGQDTNTFTLYMSRGIVSKPANGNSKVGFQVGYEVNVETTGGDRIEGRTQALQDYAVFGSVDYRPSTRFTIWPGVRAIYNSVYAAPLVPSLHIKWNVAQQWTLRASYGRGFRAPALRELYLYFVDINHNLRGNPDLRAEYSSNWNATLTHRLVRPTGVWQLEGAAFFSDVQNLISLALVDASSALYTYANIGRAQTTGGRVQATYTHAKLTASAGATYNGFANLNLPSPTFYWSPEVLLRADWQTPVAKLRLAVFGKYNGRVQQLAQVAEDELAVFTTPAYTTLDATLTRTFWKQHLHVSVGGRNLLNVRNLNASNAGGAHTSGGSVAVGTGRSWFTTLSLTF
jgi:outer membrane receptor for ferrienterochelin and colicins